MPWTNVRRKQYQTPNIGERLPKSPIQCTTSGDSDTYFKGAMHEEVTSIQSAEPHLLPILGFQLELVCNSSGTGHNEANTEVPPRLRCFRGSPARIPEAEGHRLRHSGDTRGRLWSSSSICTKDCFFWLHFTSATCICTAGSATVSFDSRIFLEAHECHNTNKNRSDRRTDGKATSHCG